MISHLLAFVLGAVAFAAFGHFYPNAATSFVNVVDAIILKVKGLFKKKA